MKNLLNTSSIYKKHVVFWRKNRDHLMRRFSFQQHRAAGNIPDRFQELICNIDEDIVKGWIGINPNDILTELISAIAIVLGEHQSGEVVLLDTPLHKDGASQSDSKSVTLCIPLKKFNSLYEFVDANKLLIRESYLYQDYSIQNLFESEIDFPLTNILVSSEVHRNDTDVHHYDMAIILETRGEGYRFKVKFKNTAFHSNFVENLLTQINKVLSYRDDLAIKEISIAPAGEIRKMMDEFNNSKRQFPENLTMHELFEKQVKETPDSIAIEFNEKRLTYDELNRMGNRLAAHLRSEYYGSNRVIGIVLDRSENMIVAILAVLKAGFSYLPLDTGTPPTRIELILADSDVAYVITDFAIAERLINYRGAYFAMDIQFSGLVGDERNLVQTSAPQDVAYIIYTSGSTGNPKGIMIEHRSNVNMSLDQIIQFGIKSNDRILQLASISFDASVSEIFMALYCGATLVLIDQESINNPTSFIDYCQSKMVNVVTFTPAYLNLFNLTDLLFLRIIISAGDVANLRHAQFFYKRLSYFNAYGPTECAVCVTINKVERLLDSETTISIGRPIANMQVYILNENLGLIPIGHVGQICVSGIGLAKGYVRHTGRENNSFIEHPFIKGERLYKTGDLGKWMPDGRIEYVGRMDSQIKINGNRVELLEVEAIINSFETVKEAVVIYDRDSHLKAYITPDRIEIENDLRNFLRSRLPGYMVPLEFIFVKEFNRTQNGKIDRKELTKLSTKSQRQHVIPTTETERKLISIWGKILKKDSISAEDNFFSLGGDSLKSIQILVLINEEFGNRMKLGDLLDHQTIRQQGLFIDTHDGLVSEIELSLSRGHEIMASIKNAIAEKPGFRLPENFEDMYPINSIETGMIYSSLLRMDEPVYCDQFTYEVTFFDIDQVLRALSFMVSRHANLRSLYYLSEFGRPLKIVLSSIDLPISHIDLRTLNKDDQKKRISLYLDEDLKHRYSFEGELLWRMKFFRISETSFFVVWSCHHSLLDGWSQNLFITELSKVISSLSGGSPISSLKHSYKDYTAISLGRVTSEVDKNFWKETLAGYSRNKLPFNYTGKALNNFGRMERETINLPSELLSKVEKFTSSQDVSLKSYFVSAYVFLLHTICSEKDIVAGVVTHDRPPISDAESIVGCFLNTIPIRIGFESPQNNTALLKSVDHYLMKANVHAMHLRDISTVIGETASETNPIFDCLINYTDFSIIEEWKESVIMREAEYELANDSALSGEGMTNTLFDLEIDKTLGNLAVSIKYVVSRFSKKDILYSLDLYTRIVEYMSSVPDGSVNSAALITSEEKNVLLNVFNNTAASYSRNETLHSIFEQQVLRSPDKIAISLKGSYLTYSELNSRANRLARLLIDSGVKNNDLVGLTTSRGFQMIIGMFAILKAGAAYIPIDPSYPESRKQYIITKANVATLIGDKDEYSKIDQDIPYVNVHDNKVSNYIDENLRLEKPSTDLAYIIFTSGSTGNPKGVMIEHHSAVNLLEWVNKELQVTDNDTVLCLTSMCFDLSVYDIFGVLSAGGTVAIAEDSNSDLILDVLTNGATIWNSVPSTMNFLVNQLSLKTDWTHGHSLRVVLLSGDWVPLALPAKIKKYFPLAQIIALGGATEATVWSNYHSVRQIEPDWVSIPYGKPISNNTFYILNEQGNLVPPGIVGELFIGGVGVGRGYVNDKEKTSGSFVRDHFTTSFGGRMYRTGDLGRMMTSGEIEFLGRIDNQVKVRGFRVELGEIENQLMKMPEIDQAVVITRKDDENQNYLCAYLVLEKPLPADVIKSRLMDLLPNYMVPSVFTMLESLPLTQNGKIDRKNLPVVTRDVHQVHKFEGPRNRMEQKVTDFWTQILSVTPISVTESLLELGAHSLNIGTFTNWCHRQFGVKVGIVDLLRNPTIEGISLLIGELDPEHLIRIPAIETQHSYETSHSQKRLWYMSYDAKRSVGYNLSSAYKVIGKLNIQAFVDTWEYLALRHESLRTTFRAIDGILMQFIANPQDFDLDYEFLDLKDNEGGQVSRLNEIQQNEEANAFDLSSGSLFRVKLVKVNDNEFRVLFTIHHLIADGWSLNILISELQTVYWAKVTGSSVALAPLRIQYKDFAHWQNRLDLNLEKDFWLSRLGDRTVKVNLPSPSSKVKFKGERFSLTLIDELKVARAFAKERNCTLSNVLLSVYAVFLNKLSGQDDLYIGVAHANRNHPDTESIVGFFVNIIVIHAHISSDQTFGALVDQLSENTAMAIKHSNYPFDFVVAQLADGKQRDLFNVRYDFQSVGITDDLADDEQIQITPIENIEIVPDADLKLSIIEEPDKLNLIWDYDVSKVDSYIFKQLLQEFPKLLLSVGNVETTPSNFIK